MNITVSQKRLIIIHSFIVFLPSIIHSRVIGKWQHILKKKRKKRGKSKTIFSKNKNKKKKEKENGLFGPLALNNE